MRLLLKYLADLALWTLALPIAYFLRIEMNITEHVGDIAILTLMTMPIKATILYMFQFHRQAWSKIGVWDLLRIIQGVVVVTFIVVVALYFIHLGLYLPRSVPVIEGGLTILMLSSIRLFARIQSETVRRSDVKHSPRKVSRVLVAGAGEAGTMLAREVRRHPESYMEIAGFLDDNPTKQKEWFLGYAILGHLDDLPEVARKHDVDKVIIAMPTVPGEVIRKVVTLAHEAGIESQIMPGLYELLSGNFNIAKLRQVDVSDLLRRKLVELDVAPISDYLYERTVLVTGAGGSIGSEIVRQIMRFNPRHVLLLGRGENSIFKVEREFRTDYPQVTFTALITDVRDRGSLEHVFRKYRPQVVFHAAAHKHVPLMEDNPDQAILNNVGGTRNLAELALEYEVERFVNISSDKSVNPTSVMGCTKRVAEYVVHRASLRANKDQSFVSVRFGNVLGSRGSVVPLFKRQIENGGPVTVTHPDMTRYFMTIPEASQLVLQAGGLNCNGSVYVLDMGQPVKIVDLARDLIRLCGLIPDRDIEITYTGMRPGEKLYEELLTDEEGTSATHHEKIFSAKINGPSTDKFELMLKDLFASAIQQDGDEVRRHLKRIVPTYIYDTRKEASEEAEELSAPSDTEKNPPRPNVTLRSRKKAERPGEALVSRAVTEAQQSTVEISNN